MWKKALAALAFVGIGFAAYDYYTSPYYGAPELNEDDFLLAFDGGLRGVMRGFGDRDQTRRYMSYGAKNVPDWFQETWSTCRTPKSDEATAFKNEVDMGPGGRLDAVCEIDADGDIFVRGWVVSVPDL